MPEEEQFIDPKHVGGGMMGAPKEGTFTLPGGYKKEGCDLWRMDVRKNELTREILEAAEFPFIIGASSGACASPYDYDSQHHIFTHLPRAYLRVPAALLHCRRPHGQLDQPARLGAGRRPRHAPRQALPPAW